MTEGKVASWAVPEGAEIVGRRRAGRHRDQQDHQRLSKCPVDGILRRRVAPEQQDLPVGALLGVIADASVPDAEIDAFVAHFQAEFAADRDEARERGGAGAADRHGGRPDHPLLWQAARAAAPPVVLIHGFGGDLNNWMFNQPALAAAHRTIAIDLPGHGGSEKRVEAGDVAGLAQAWSRCWRRSASQRAHLVGHSLGGAIALRHRAPPPGARRVADR